MRLFGMFAAAVCILSLWAVSAQADERTPIRLLDNAGANTSVTVMPVRVGTGWRGGGYYPGYNRPYYSNSYRYGNGYSNGYNGYRYGNGYSSGYRGGYYGGYNGYYGGYNGYNGGYYRPYNGYSNGYYNAYRPYYGGYYRY
jgi:hypothetical protein